MSAAKARKSLGAMLADSVAPAVTPGDKPIATNAAPATVSASSKTATAAAAPTPASVATTATTPAPGPAAKWVTFEPKQTRQRADQIQWVETKRKELNAQRQGAGERLTDNTLIRVAIDLLIQNGAQLHGITEVELRRSLGITLENE